MPRLEAVLFDLDGTLIDSAPALWRALNLMLAEEGRAEIELDKVRDWAGEGLMEMCRRALLATGGATADDLYPHVQKLIAHYRAGKPTPDQIFPGTRETLEALGRKGIKLGVCTNMQESATLHLLEDLDLLRYFGFVAGGNTFEVHKPHPGHVLGVLNALEVLPENAAFVGDGPNDVLACHKAGVPVILIAHGKKEDFTSMGADVVIGDYAQLEEALAKLGFVD